MEIETEKRSSYSIFFFPSVLHGRQLRLDASRALESLLVELETTPGVMRWELTDYEVPFTFDGRARSVSLPLFVKRKRHRGQLLQLLAGRGTALEEAAVKAGQAFAEARKFEHVPVPANRLNKGPHEKQNREAAHAWLRSAARWNTRELESRLVSAVRARAAHLSSLRAELSLTETQVRLVFVRAWLSGEVSWDIGNDPVMHDLLVRPT